MVKSNTRNARIGHLELQVLDKTEKPVFDLPIAKVQSLSRARQNDEVTDTTDELEYPGHLTLSFILVALLMAMFLVPEPEAIIVEAGIH